MPVYYFIDSSLNLLYYSAVGKCKGNQFVWAARQSFGDPLRRPNMKIIFDLLAMKELDYDISILRDGVKHLREWRNLGNTIEKTAVLTHDSLANNLITAFESMAFDFTLHWHVFRDLPSSLVWLDLSEAASQVMQIQSSFPHE